jgi:hypothetical protein
MAEREGVFTINAPHFNAGVVFENAFIVRAAPIVSYMVGWSMSQLRRFLDKKGWSLSV